MFIITFFYSFISCVGIHVNCICDIFHASCLLLVCVKMILMISMLQVIQIFNIENALSHGFEMLKLLNFGNNYCEQVETF